jgi:3-hydroxybutyryl-CoA dehydratase
MNPEKPLTFDQLSVGMARENDYAITPAVYEAFLGTFNDRSPVHTDAEHARSQGFEGLVMHGAILNGFLSNFIGMVFPGANTLELSVELRYLKPCYLNDTVRLQGKVAQKLEANSVVVLHVSYQNLTQRVLAANGRVQVKITA